MEEAIAYFLDLRGRLRGSPEARLLVERCMGMLARAARADVDRGAVADDVARGEPRELEVLRR